MQHLIIGKGEIGTGIYDVLSPYYHVRTYDSNIKLDSDNRMPEGLFDVLHICIPGGLKNFVDIVSNYILNYQPKLVIVHSTVPVGTCTNILITTRNHPMSPHFSIVHSPVRGKHPHMRRGLATYVKYIGYCDSRGKVLTEQIYEQAGLKFRSLPKCETTELGKILSTTDYGVNLMWAKIKNDLCRDLELDYADVVGDFTETYNGGVRELGCTQYTKQELTPPSDKVGGHCVIENSYLLTNQFNDNENLNELMYLLIRLGKGDRKLDGYDE